MDLVDVPSHERIILVQNDHLKILGEDVRIQRVILSVQMVLSITDSDDAAKHEKMVISAQNDLPKMSTDDVPIQINEIMCALQDSLIMDMADVQHLVKIHLTVHLGCSATSTDDAPYLLVRDHHVLQMDLSG